MKICVIGAYGYTGKIICQELERRGLAFAIAGRDSQKLASFSASMRSVPHCFSGEITHPQFVEELLSSFDLLVNCAGPFEEESWLLLKSISSSGKIYLDISGEIGFIKSSFENYNKAAVDSGSLILHGCAFESFISALELQRLVGENRNYIGFRTCYDFAQKRFSPGTKLTMKLSQYRTPFVVKNSSWAVSDLQLDRFTLETTGIKRSKIAVPYPLPEIAFTQWSYAPEFSESLLILSVEEAAFTGMTRTPRETVQEAHQRLRQRKQAGPSEQERKEQCCTLTCILYTEGNRSVATATQCQDMYGLTGRIICLLIDKIIQNRGAFSGVLNPASLFEGNEGAKLEELECFFEPVQNFTLK